MKPNTLDGVKMLHHDEMRNYDRIQGKIISVIMNHGCKIVETPSFEDYDVYQHFFPHLRRQMVKTIDTDGRVLVLRPDVTLPLVESAAREFPRPNQLLKFGYVSTVFREYFGRSTYGKDFLQGGIEIDLLAVGRKGRRHFGGRVIGEASRASAVGGHHIDVHIAFAVAGKSNLPAVGRPHGRRFVGGLRRKPHGFASLCIHFVEVALIAENDLRAVGRDAHVAHP